MITLGIETSCDETAAAVLRDTTVLSNVVASQVQPEKAECCLRCFFPYLFPCPLEMELLEFRALLRG